MTQHRRHRRLKAVAWTVVHTIRLRRVWSQAGAYLQLAGRRSFLPLLRQILRNIIRCRRPIMKPPLAAVKQTWTLLGPLIRKRAPLFAHLHSVHGHLRFRDIRTERQFRRLVSAQLALSGNQDRWFQSFADQSHRYLQIPFREQEYITPPVRRR